MNTNMRLFTLILILLTPAWATGEVIDSDVSLRDFTTINIRIHDDVENGCWTNISETKSYAADQLELIGGKIDRNTDSIAFEGNPDGSVTFYIHVKGGYVIDNLCVGNIDIKLINFTRGYSNFGGIIFYSTFGARLADYSNFNSYVLDAVKIAVKDWKD